MQVIPAIDIYRNRCVRLTEGEFAHKTTYSTTPFAAAEQFTRAGARALHVVDLEGAREGRILNVISIAKIRLLKDVEIQVGGGIRTEESVRFLLDMGIDRVGGGSVAVRAPELFASWIKNIGAYRFCVALDLKDEMIAYIGWEHTDAPDFTSTVNRLTD